MQEILKLPVYTGTIPNKATQSDNEFANNIFGFINYSGNVFVGNFNTIIGQFNVLKDEINTAASEISDNKTFVSNAKTYVAQTIALLPNGTINNITAGDDKTYSSKHIDNLLKGSATQKFQVEDGTEDKDAVNKGQLDTKAKKSGSATQKFQVEDGTEDNDAVNKGQLNVAISKSISTGSIIAYPSQTVPSGYLECNGSLLSRITYASLFAIIGTTYGVGDGSTTFNIPDLRGIFIRGLDNGRGLDTGRTIGSYQADEFKSHAHTIAPMWANGMARNDDSSGIYTWSRNTSSLNTNSSGGVETRPKNTAMMYCIKY